MQQLNGQWIYAASDLNNFLECDYLVNLDRSVALGERPKPVQDDPQVELIARKGDEHERRYLDDLRSRHACGLTEFPRPDHSIAAFEEAERATIAAMERGDHLIYQATFFHGAFLGHPDFLRRVEVPCDRWAWSYEVIDTKLALSTKPYFIIQLCNYSGHLERIQGTAPEFGYIVLGNGEEKRYRLNDYSAYYRHLKRRFLERAAQLAGDPSVADEAYPNKCSHCKVCKWDSVCEKKRANDDHLSLVARMRGDQIVKLNAHGIHSVVELAAARDEHRPDRMNADTFAALRRQATMQVRGRTEGPCYELIEHAPLEGFGLLPAPAKGDVFFDMEGDPLYEPGRSLEYLFGCWLPDDEPKFKPFWALSRAEERAAFEAFVDFIVARCAQYPGMHVYHYADYEKAALRRLAQMHGTREQEVDDLLRGEVLVDLYAVVRQALVISEDSYSIKRLEKFYNFTRTTEVRRGDDSIVMFETWLAAKERRDILEDIERYNEDDCRSTLLLRDWLIERTVEVEAQFGIQIQPYVSTFPCHDEPLTGCKKCAERQKLEREAKATTELQTRLMDGVLAPQTESEYAAMSDDHRARYLMANLLAYHRREEKPVWWTFFDRCENADKLLEFDSDAIGGLRYCDDIQPKREKKSWLYTYAFPDQQYKIDVGDEVNDPATRKSCGTVFALDEDANRITIKWSGSAGEARNIRALIPGGPRNTGVQKAALVRIGESYLNGSIEPAALDLLLSRDSRTRGAISERQGAIQPDEVTPEAVSAVAQSLADSYLFIQGPPGTGKTYVGARVICDLLADGKRVGVMSNGHKAIHHLLHKVEECAHERGFTFIGRYKYSDGDSQYYSPLNQAMVDSTDNNADFDVHDYQLAGGTSWLFARESLANQFDYLFIDEAGQVALANAVAVSQCAKNMILLGDPLQLAQVSKGTHPLHAGDSVLQHLLGDAQTVPPHRGVFLDVSYRMHPEICRFVSETTYGGRLYAAPGNEMQCVQSDAVAGAGLRYYAAAHKGNSRESLEEADVVVDAVADVLKGDVTDHKGLTRRISASDVIVVTPYNAQRRLIKRMFEERGIDVRIGTVDKFQGQEAFVVFYTMASSDADAAPRGTDFLCDRRRFNVAISRGRSISSVVCSDSIRSARCRTDSQIALLNSLCRFVELCASVVESRVARAGDGTI